MLKDELENIFNYTLYISYYYLYFFFYNTTLNNFQNPQIAKMLINLIIQF